MRRRPLAVCVLLALAVSVAACGNDRQDAPRLPHAAVPAGKRTEHFARFGVTFTRPRNWVVSGGSAPRVASISSGRAIVTVWRYRRVERLPRSAADLVRARKALVASVKKRDRTIRILSARPLRIGGAPALMIVADEKIGLVRREVRSAHVYAQGGEVVVDAYAPRGEFAAVDRTMFGPLLRSVRLTRPAPPAQS